MGFDFAKIETVTEALPMQVTDPITGDPIEGMVLYVYGMDSREFQKESRRISERLQRRLRMNPKAIISEEDREDNALALLAACTAKWEGVDYQGQPFPCSRENAVKLYAAAPWLRRQVDQFLGDQANFLRVSGNGSPGE